MAVYIHKSNVGGEVVVPSSKSLSHRALLAGLLSKNDTKIYNLLDCEDTKATISIMEALGKKVIYKDGYHLVTNGSDRIDNDILLNANESGSTLRFIIPILSLYEGKHLITGTKKLLSRPLDIYKELYQKDGLYFNLTENALEVEGKLKGGKYEVRGDISSQFISGLLFTLPLLSVDSEIIITGKFESKSYVDLTIEVLNHFGIEIKEVNNVYYIKGNQEYSAKDYAVPGDYSQMAFWAVLGTINNDLEIAGMLEESKQGDKEIVDILNNSCNNITYENDKYYVRKEKVGNLNIDLSMIPDLGPILGVLCSRAEGLNKIYNAERLKFKESDRLNAIDTELKKMNVKSKIVADSLLIEKCDDIKCLEVIDSHNDHRIFMAFAILGTISSNGVRINDEKCINKSYPNFLKDLQSVGVIVDYE